MTIQHILIRIGRKIQDIHMTDQKQAPQSSSGITGNTTKFRWSRGQRIVALIAILLLLAMYILAFISALMATPGHAQMFRLCIGLTIAVPVFSWILIYAIGFYSRKHTIASIDLLNSNPEARKEMEDALQREMQRGEELKAAPHAKPGAEKGQRQA